MRLWLMDIVIAGVICAALVAALFLAKTTRPAACDVPKDRLDRELCESRQGVSP
jgi:hypothetical protein